MQWQLQRDSSAVRAPVRITRGPGFNPQSRCLNFFRFSVLMSVLSFDGYKNNGLLEGGVARNSVVILVEEENIKAELLEEAELPEKIDAELLEGQNCQRDSWILLKSQDRGRIARATFELNCLEEVG